MKQIQIFDLKRKLNKHALGNILYDRLRRLNVPQHNALKIKPSVPGVGR